MPKYYEDLIGQVMTIVGNGGEIIKPVVQDVKAGDHEGEDDKIHAFDMVAYTGVEIRQFFSNRVVVDLEGMEIPGSGLLPILANHDDTKIVGHGTAAINGSVLTVKGLISGTGPFAVEVKNNSLNGFPYQASIGAEIMRLEDVEAGEQVNVNGMDFVGPLLVVRGSKLRESSFLPAGADDNTSATVAASFGQFNKGSEMFEKWLKLNGFVDVTDENQLKLLRASFEAEQKVEADAVVEADKKVRRGPQSRRRHKACGRYRG